MKSRRGMTLPEMAIAILVASIVLVSITVTVSHGVATQQESDRLAVAVSLAQTKLSQLMSNPNLTAGKNNGQFGQEGGLYAGYAYEIEIKEERIDLTKVATEGELKPVAAKDQLPPGGQNQESTTSRNVTGSATGGLVDIVRIIVKIRYPKGGQSFGEYRVETFKGAPKKI